VTPALLALVATLAAPPPASHPRFPPAAATRVAVSVLAVGASGSGFPKPARPRGRAFAPGFRDTATAAVVVPPFRFDPAAADPPALEALFLGRDRAYRVRVTALPGGEAWPATVRKLFNAFDRDGDGTLNAFELEHVFSLPGIKELGGGEFYTQAFAVPGMGDVDRDGDGRASPDELVYYYREAVADLLRAQAVPANDGNSEAVTAAVLARLDTNNDGRLSEAELRQAERLVFSLDADEDDCLTLAEFQAGGAPRTAAMMAGAGMMGGNEQEQKAVEASPDDLIAALGALPGDAFKRLLTRYDGDRDGVLKGHEIPFDAATAKALDADRDGTLTLTELYALSRQPADIVVTMTQAADAAGCAVTVSGGTSAELPEGFTARRADAARVVLRRGATVLTFAAVPADTKAVRRRFAAMVDGLGVKDGAIPESSLGNVQNQYLRIVSDAADRDFDGRLTPQELKDYFGLQLLVASRAAALETTVRRPDLFQLLDDNGDGKLSVRELRTAWDRLSVMAPAGSRFVTREVLQPAASVRLTNRAVTGFEVVAPQVASSTAARPAVEGSTAVTGPVWFRKMDRNSDGDLSRVEFLGDAAAFAAIDANADGLISRDEATAYDAKVRPKSVSPTRKRGTEPKKK
jgi:Ca2+-binding EF-hand superfamily protein